MTNPLNLRSTLRQLYFQGYTDGVNDEGEKISVHDPNKMTVAKAEQQIKELPHKK